MKYQLIGDNNLFDPLEQIFINRGIRDYKDYLKSFNDPNVVNHYSKLKNIDKAVNCLLKHISGDSKKIWVQVDPDVDGYTSSAILIDYINKNFSGDIDLKWRLPEGKEHGIKAKNVPDGTNLVIVPDAGSSDYKEHKKLYERGIDIVVLDHHQADKESEHAIVVNNQLSPEYKNKDFSGVGIVYKFLQALDDELKIKQADKYLDLVALGNVGDMMSLHSKETRYYITQGLKKIKNPLLKEVFTAQVYSTNGKKNPTVLGFYIAPLFNALIRCGTTEEKEQVFKALLDDGRAEVFYERKEIYEPLTTNTVRMMKNIRVRQNKLRDEGVANIEKKIKEKNLLDNKVLVVEVSDLLDSELTGLVANMLRRKHKRPVLLLMYDEKSDSLSGSARGYESGSIKDFKGYIQNTGYFEFAEGHSNAFGLKIPREKLIDAVDWMNDDINDVSESVYEVDFIIPSKSLHFDIFSEIEKAEDWWGKDIEEPLLVIEDIEVERRSIKVIGKNENVIKFSIGNSEAIKFRATEEDKKALCSGKPDEVLVINIAGRASVNEWRGNRTGQIIIEDYEVTDKKKKKLIF